MSINDRVKLLRQALHLTQVEFGSRIAVAQGYLTNIETGKREVTDKIQKIICAEFNVNEQWLRTGEGEMFTQANTTIIDELANQYGLDELDKKILSRYLELPEQYRKVLKEYLMWLVENSGSSETDNKPHPVPAPGDPIEEELESYRKEMEAERMGSTSSHSAG